MIFDKTQIISNKKMSRIISVEISNNNEDMAELSPEDISCLKYAPIVSTDVERSFTRQHS